MKQTNAAKVLLKKLNVLVKKYGSEEFCVDLTEEMKSLLNSDEKTKLNWKTSDDVYLIIDNKIPTFIHSIYDKQNDDTQEYYYIVSKYYTNDTIYKLAEMIY